MGVMIDPEFTIITSHFIGWEVLYDACVHKRCNPHVIDKQYIAYKITLKTNDFVHMFVMRGNNVRCTEVTKMRSGSANSANCTSFLLYIYFSQPTTSGVPVTKFQFSKRIKRIKRIKRVKRINWRYPAPRA
jgi:hypothetical protein